VGEGTRRASSAHRTHGPDCTHCTLGAQGTRRAQ
jgi:hypothetical protein